MHLIFKNNQLVAHTERKEFVKRYIARRKNNMSNFEVVKIPKENMTDDMISSAGFKVKEIYSFTEYERVMTQAELNQLIWYSTNEIIQLQVVTNRLINYIQMVKMDRKEKDLVYKWLMDIMLIFQTESIIPDMYLNMQKMIDDYICQSKYMPTGG